MKKVILISGKLNSGKNTFADILTKTLKRKKFKVVNDLFAKGVKDGAKKDFAHFSNLLNSIKDSLIEEKNLLEKNASAYGIKLPTQNLNLLIQKLSINDKNWYEDKTDLTRRLLQIYGTDIFRKRVDDLYWVNKVKERILKSDADYYILTDVRFPNEIDNIFNEKYQTIPIRINRNVKTESNIAKHESENALDNYKYFFYKISNNKSLKDLKISVKTFLEDLKNKP